MKDWLKLNLHCKGVNSHDGTPWKITFISFLWNIWKNRNKEVIDDVIEHPTTIAWRANNFAREVSYSFLQFSVSNFIKAPDLFLCLPRAGMIKLNADGSVQTTNRKYGFGGVF